MRAPFKKIWLWGALCFAAIQVLAWIAVPVAEDPHLFMPGSQHGDVVLESSSQCLSCHAGYDPAVEPGRNWQGSMMAQAARDPLWAASMAVAVQDSIWLLGNANAGDLCIRCHSPVGWLGGRSDPPNASALDGSLGDLEGVNCSACHQMLDPISGERQADWLREETDPVILAAADTTYAQDQNLLASFVLFDQSNFYDSAEDLPVHYGDGALPNYIEASSGQYFMEDPHVNDFKRGNRHDSEPKSHSVYYSRFHKTAMQCGACHDVSNSAMANVVMGEGTSSTQSAASYFHIERTLSEFILSDFGRLGGSPTRGSLAASGISHASSCQDCHMPVSSGKACNKNVPVRDDLRVHDLTGGNVWLSQILSSVDQNSGNPTADSFNYDLLSGTRYPAATVDVAGLQGLGPALSDGAARAEANLQRAADLHPLSDAETTASLRIYNNTGHKLISGFPEGRRMWLSLEFFDAAGNPIKQINGYEQLVITRDSGGVPAYVSGGLLSRDRDDLIFEAKMESDFTGETGSFHMVLATDRYKDNRIPPRGFDVSASVARLAHPRHEGADALDYFSAEEYAGGYHDVSFEKPVGTVTWQARLYYQTTSYEYIKFLRDEINGTADTLDSPTPSGETEAYIAQTDAFFDGLKDWGHAIWELWLHNDGAPPVEMTATISPPKIINFETGEGGFEITFQTHVGRTYQIDACDDLVAGNWTAVYGPVNGNGASLSFSDTNSASHSNRFYRLVNSLEE